MSDRVEHEPPNHGKPQPADVYELVPMATDRKPAPAPPSNRLQAAKRGQSQPAHETGFWRRLIQLSSEEASHVEREGLALVALSAADLLITYALLRNGPSFYESNPIANWLYLRWNIAGMAIFKFGMMGVVIVIGEVVEHRRPGWGRGLLLVSCLVTMTVVGYGLSILWRFTSSGLTPP
jgi:hypothetical protein